MREAGVRHDARAAAEGGVRVNAAGRFPGFRRSLRLLLAAWLAALAAPAPAAGDFEARLKTLSGYWLAQSEAAPQARVLRITNVILADADSAVLAGLYGPPAPVLPEARDITARLEGGRIMLDIVSADGAAVSLSHAAAGRLQGTQRHRDGTVSQLRFSAASLAQFHRFVAENPQPEARAGRGARIELVYVGADDCSQCRAWEAGHLGPRGKLESSAEWQRLRFTVVKLATLKAAFRVEDAPERLRPLFHAMMADGPRIQGVPSFVLLVNGALRAHALGSAAFATLIEPALRAAVREKRAAERT